MSQWIKVPASGIDHSVITAQTLLRSVFGEKVILSVSYDSEVYIVEYADGANLGELELRDALINALPLSFSVDREKIAADGIDTAIITIVDARLDPLYELVISAWIDSATASGMYAERQVVPLDNPKAKTATIAFTTEFVGDYTFTVELTDGGIIPTTFNIKAA